jgi:V/A-type H+-transporting ATPase subunit B
VAIIGEEALTPTDRMYLKLAETFEQQMINQGNTDRSILETLELGWRLLSHLPERELKRVSRINLGKYYIPGLEDEWETPAEKLSTTPAESVHT